MAHGGKRNGAGRKPKAAYRQSSPVQAAENKLRDRLPELVDEAIRQALEDHSEAQTRYCIDRILGKAVQPIDLDVKRAADRLASATGADPEFLIRRAQQLADENAAGTG